METRKIALIIFLVGLIFLSLGAIVYVARQRSEVNNLQTGKIAASPAVSSGDSAAKAGDSGLVTAEGRPISEEQITAKIEATKAQISQKAKGRDYTSEEISFMLFPRQTAINELKKGQ